MSIVTWSDLIKLAEEQSDDRLGEGAYAAGAALTGSLAGRAIPLIANYLIDKKTAKESPEWEGPPVKRAPTMRDIEQRAHIEAGIDDVIKSSDRLMGLYSISREHAPLGKMLDALSPKERAKQNEMLREAHRSIMLADPFIEKYKLADKGVRLNLQSGLFSGFGGGSFVPATGEVFLPRVGAENVLHELGHAADFTTPVGRVRGLLGPAIHNAASVALPVAIIAGDEIKKKIPGTIDDKTISFMQENAPELTAATLAATTLYPEAKASLLAIKHIRSMEQMGSKFAPPGSTAKAVRRLAPLFGSYLLGTVPAVIGMSLAKRYMQQHRMEKEAGVIGDVTGYVSNTAKAMWDDFTDAVIEGARASKQIGTQTAEILQSGEALKRIGAAAKHVGTSPEFVYGAIGAGLPAGLGALYVYGTPGGQALQEQAAKSPSHPYKEELHVDSRFEEDWKRSNPLRYAGLVAAGAALSGGVMAKLMGDLRRIY